MWHIFPEQEIISEVGENEMEKITLLRLFLWRINLHTPIFWVTLWRVFPKHPLTLAPPSVYPLLFICSFFLSLSPSPLYLHLIFLMCTPSGQRKMGSWESLVLGYGLSPPSLIHKCAHCLCHQSSNQCETDFPHFSSQFKPTNKS